MKPIKPLPHAFADYAVAIGMIAAPWLFGFSQNKKATISSVATGAGILGLSLTTRYPLGTAKLISFPTHGVIETVAAASTVAAPWTLGFAANKAALTAHLVAGLGTLGVVALTDYQATERGDAAQDLFETFGMVELPEAVGSVAVTEDEVEAETSKRIAS